MRPRDAASRQQFAQLSIAFHHEEAPEIRRDAAFVARNCLTMRSKHRLLCGDHVDCTGQPPCLTLTFHSWLPTTAALHHLVPFQLLITRGIEVLHIPAPTIMRRASKLEDREALAWCYF